MNNVTKAKNDQPSGSVVTTKPEGPEKLKGGLRANHLPLSRPYGKEMNNDHDNPATPHKDHAVSATKEKGQPSKNDWQGREGNDTLSLNAVITRSLHRSASDAKICTR